MDKVDRTEERLARAHADNIEYVRAGNVHLDGPVRCVKCSGRNDRKDEGYAVCSECVEEVD